MDAGARFTSKVRNIGWVAVAFLFAACGAARKPNLAAGNECIVTGPAAPFFKHGPAQGHAAELELEKGQRVTLLSKRMGYSHVMTADGEFGYVADDQLQVVARAPKVMHLAARTGPVNPSFPIPPLPLPSNLDPLSLPPLPEPMPASGETIPASAAEPALPAQ